MFAYFLLTEHELFLIFSCRWWINSIWHSLSVRKKSWENKISSEAKSHRAGVALSLSHLVTAMLPVAQLSWCHSVEGWTLRATLDEGNSWCTVCVRIADSSWDASCHKDFKAVYLEEQERRNNLFWWLYFLFVKYEQTQLMTPEPRSVLFILVSCPGAAGGSCPVIISHIIGGGRLCDFSTSARGDDRAQLPVEEEPEMKTNCFKAPFHIKHQKEKAQVAAHVKQSIVWLLGKDL